MSACRLVWAMAHAIARDTRVISSDSSGCAMECIATYSHSQCYMHMYQAFGCVMRRTVGTYKVRAMYMHMHMYMCVTCGTSIIHVPPLATLTPRQPRTPPIPLSSCAPLTMTSHG